MKHSIVTAVMLRNLYCLFICFIGSIFSLMVFPTFKLAILSRVKLNTPTSSCRSFILISSQFILACFLILSLVFVIVKSKPIESKYCCTLSGVIDLIVHFLFLAQEVWSLTG